MTITETERTPRPEKVALVDEIAGKLEGAQAVFVTEYRGMTVGDLAGLRRSLRDVDAEHKIYKNSLAKFAVQRVGLEGLDEILVGPTALTFARSDSAGVAKALRDLAKTNQNLILKGGSLSGSFIDVAGITALADLPSRDELLAKLAGGLQAPLVKTAGLLQALPRNFAYGLSALIDQKAAA